MRLKDTKFGFLKKYYSLFSTKERTEAQRKQIVIKVINYYHAISIF